MLESAAHKITTHSGVIVKKGYVARVSRRDHLVSIRTKATPRSLSVFHKRKPGTHLSNGL